MNSQNFSRTPPEASVKLILSYIPPSLNVLHGRHWSIRYREKKKAAIAMLFALESLEYDHWMRTMHTEALRHASTYLLAQASCRRTRRKRSRLKLNRKKLLIAKSSEPKSQSHGPKA